MKERKVTLDSLLENRNVGGNPYLCDITRFFGIDIPEARRLQKKLKQVADLLRATKGKQ
jgi:hypothetical protein